MGARSVLLHSRDKLYCRPSVSTWYNTLKAGSTNLMPIATTDGG
jgi:hypothetical protein